MPRRDQIATDHIYHICNRGVDKRNIFIDEKDYLRGIHDLFEFNDYENNFNAGRLFQLIDSRRQSIGANRKERKLLVDVLAFCLMPNHFHFLLKQRLDNGIQLFLKKFTMGYAKYFNAKYNRSGTLFQGRFKAVLVSRESHFLHLPFYIHLNPLDLAMPGWRSGEINKYEAAVNFLESYRWSSHLDYSGTKNFPSVTQRDLLLNFFNGPENYKSTINSFLKNMSEEKMEDLKDVAIEP